MKRVMFLTALVICLASCIGEKFATGDVESRTFTISGDIDAIAASASFDVTVDPTLSQGEVVVSTHTDIFDKVDISVDGTTLNIDLNSWILRARTLAVRVPVYEYNTIAMSGGVDFSWLGCNVPSLTIAVSGGADVEIEAECQDIMLATSGGADVELWGSSHSFVVAASGGADVDAIRLIADRVEVSASGGADVEVYATESLKIEASGGADVSYAGNPTNADINASGGADVSREN